MNDYVYYAHVIHSLFDQGFMDAYRDANPRRRKRILPYLQAVHRRWYYSTLVENTPFSPANFIEGICRSFEIEPDTYTVPEPRTKAKLTSIDMAVRHYTLENHPVVEDMKVLISYCSPYVDLMEEGFLSDTQSLEISRSLSIADPHYASFLMALAGQMKLVTKMPALYITRMQISKTCQETMALPGEELLRKIVDAAIALAAFGLSESIPVPERIFTETFIREILTVPMETDDIFAKVFAFLGYDIEDLLDISSMTMDDSMDTDDLGVDMELLSGTFVMGIVLDRFFFTPFGHYLRIIRPMYVLPFDFDAEISEYMSVCNDPEEAFVAFFAPCSSYTLTDIGLEIMGVEANSKNYFDVNDIMPFEGMKNTVFSCAEAFETFVEMARMLSPLSSIMGQYELPDSVYTFRVRMEEDSSAWVHIQAPDNITLGALYEEIAGIFELNPNSDYSFFHDKTENRFAEYGIQKKPAAKGKKANVKKSPDILLSDMDFDHMAHMILVSYSPALTFGKIMTRLNLERLSVKEPEIGASYPRVSRTSSAMKFLRDDE